MRTAFFAGILVIACGGSLQASGLLIPDDKSLPPLGMVYHRVNIAIEDQVAVTTVEQSFRNHTDRQLEATYVFPVPRGASVNRFTMSVNGKDVGGELLDASKARQIYTDIVRRTQDPGLLEYIGNDMMRLRVFPVMPRSDQKVSVRFTSMSSQDAGLVEYVYPLKTDAKSTRTLEDFTIKASIRTQRPLQSIYSATHAIDVKRSGDRSAEILFERNQAVLDKDFQLFYSFSGAAVGLTSLVHRPVSSEDGYFLFLINPPFESSAPQIAPRDIVFVLDTSGSMAGIKMDQAKKALRYCLENVNPHDRFAVLNFSTTIGKYRDQLVDASKDHLENARRWVDNLTTSGGTAIDDALNEALGLRRDDDGRTFTIIFFTDGQPTIGEVNPEKILKRFATRNSTNTRVFTFGVGDDVNATMLDRLAEQTRAVSTYVRPAEDIEIKASGLVSKISHPVLTNLKLTTSDSARFSEVYPPQLPDLFAGGQLVVLGRFSGNGPTTLKLTGRVGMESREHVYEVNLAAKGGEDRDFIENLWARRKVGYLLDQIRSNGEKKELIDEVTSLGKKYGIATPYTSYLIVPDGSMPVVGGARFVPGNTPLAPGGGGGGAAPSALHRVAATGAPAPPQSVAGFAKENQSKPGELARTRDELEEKRLKDAGGKGEGRKLLAEAASKKEAFDLAKASLAQRRHAEVQAGKLGVDLSIESNALRNQTRLTPSAVRNVFGRNCLEIGGVWIDDGYEARMPTLVIKAQSPAYFRILERQPKIKDLFGLGNHLLWVSPNKTALVIDTTEGKETLSDAEIDALFAKAK